LSHDIEADHIENLVGPTRISLTQNLANIAIKYLTLLQH